MDLIKFSTTQDVEILTRPIGSNDMELDWMKVGVGPGYFDLNPEEEVGLFLPRAEDDAIATLVEEWENCSLLIYVDLTEGRRVSDVGLQHISRLTQLSALNLSACKISNQGLEYLYRMPNLEWLDLSYCTGISDNGTRRIEEMRTLRYVNLRGCPRITRAGLKRLEKRRDLEINH
ncbi:MAG: hypothetical protein JW750_11060 [Anaerolineaceae bacterium]|nr:hypothetical protein [Anaerolineaceae bacterium]